LIRFGAVAGRVAATTDKLLADNVFSCRLAKRPPFWKLKNRQRAWERYRGSVRRDLKAGRANALCTTDVAGYFASIDSTLLDRRLRALNCDAEAVDELQRMLTCWQSRDGLRGLPIGTDAARLIANAFLCSSDQHLIAAYVPFARWMDDFLLPGKAESDCDRAVGALDHGLEELKLRRSFEKTHRYSDSVAALRALTDEYLASLEVSCEDDGRAGDEIRQAFDREVAGGVKPNISRLHWLLGAMTKRRDAYAVPALAARPDLMNLDPRYTGDYFMVTGLSAGRAIDDVLTSLVQAPSDSTDALQLQLLRSIPWPGKRGDAQKGASFEISPPIDPAEHPFDAGHGLLWGVRPNGVKATSSKGSRKNATYRYDVQCS
jgi:hypothetical protein